MTMTTMETDTTLMLLDRVLQSLRTSFPSSLEEEAAPPRPSGIAAASAVTMSLPALSLHHETHFADRNDRKQVEEHAACLLARPLTMTIPSFSENVPRTLMENLADSFGVLVDCRMRAYATFMARHGIALARKCQSEGVLSMETKVASLLETGKSVHAKSMTLEFSRAEECKDSSSSSSSSPVSVSLTVTMQLEMTRPSGVKDLLPVNIDAQGQAVVNSSSSQVVITLDTRKLLETMIHQASNVVAAVVDVSHTSSILPESNLCRSSSFLAMPPPPPSPHNNNSSNSKRRSQSFLMLHHPASDVGDDANAAAANSTNEEDPRATIVSPDTRAVEATSCQVPLLDLQHRDAEDEEEEEEDDEYFLQDLSPEVCETIVDGIFGGFDSSSSSYDDGGEGVLSEEAQPPAPKKPRLVVS